MKLLGIRAKNFRLFQDLNLKFKDLFADSFVLFVKGINRSTPALGSNGSGKSLFGDIISWGLYGKPLRTTRAAFPLTRGKTTEVGIRFRIDKSNFKILRTRSRTAYNTILKKDGVDISLATNEETNLLIKSLIGCDYDTFRCIVAFAQDDKKKRFVARNDRQRKEILLSATNLKEILYIPKLLKIKYQKLLEKKFNLEIKREQNKTKVVRLKERIKSLGKAQAKVEEQTTKRLAQIARSRQVLGVEIVRLQVVLGQLAGQGVAHENGVKLLDERQNKIQAKIYKLENKKREKENIASIKEGKQNGLSRILKDIEKEKEKFEELGECPVCFQKVTTLHKKVCEKIFEEKISPLEEDIARLKKEARELKERAVGLHRKIEILVNKKLKIEEKIKPIHAEMKSTNMEYAMVEEKIKSNKCRIKELDREENDVIESKTNYEKDIIRLKDTLLAIKEKRNIIINKIEEVQLKKEIYDYIKEACGPKGIVADVLPEVISNFEQYTNMYLEKMTDRHISVKFEISDEEGKMKKTRFDILISDKNKDGYVEFDEWSGGEKTRIETAINLALSKIMSSRINFSLFDEDIFQYLEEEGVRHVCQIIEEEAVKDSRNIIVISHDPFVENYFNNQIIVTCDGASSTVSY